MYDVPVCAIYQGNLLRELAKVVQNGRVCDKETNETNSPAAEKKLLPKRERNAPIMLENKEEK